MYKPRASPIATKNPLSFFTTLLLYLACLVLVTAHRIQRGKATRMKKKQLKVGRSLQARTKKMVRVSKGALVFLIAEKLPQKICC